MIWSGMGVGLLAGLAWLGYRLKNPLVLLQADALKPRPREECGG